MTTKTLLIMMGYAFGMACGQVLFKKAALVALHADPSLGLFRYLNLYLVLGLILYAALTALWMWLLQSVALSLAYPFVAMSFVWTPVMAAMFFGESLSRGYLAGLACIIVGIVVIARQ